MCLVLEQIQPVGEVEMAEEQDCSPCWTPEGCNQGEDELHQPSFLPASYQEQSGWCRQAQEDHSCGLEIVEIVRDVVEWCSFGCTVALEFCFLICSSRHNFLFVGRLGFTCSVTV
jgi:hypothetical protein